MCWIATVNHSFKTSAVNLYVPKIPQIWSLVTLFRFDEKKRAAGSWQEPWSVEGTRDPSSCNDITNDVFSAAHGHARYARFALPASSRKYLHRPVQQPHRDIEVKHVQYPETGPNLPDRYLLQKSGKPPSVVLSTVLSTSVCIIDMMLLIAMLEAIAHVHDAFKWDLEQDLKRTSIDRDLARLGIFRGVFLAKVTIHIATLCMMYSACNFNIAGARTQLEQLTVLIINDFRNVP